MAARGHVHAMRSAQPVGVKPREYGCTSCAFRCTARSLAAVERNPGKHVRVKPGSPAAAKPWDIEDGAR
jgi:hypothetical protein